MFPLTWEQDILVVVLVEAEAFCLSGSGEYNQVTMKWVGMIGRP